MSAAIIEQKYKDNVYKEVKIEKIIPSKVHVRKKKMLNRRTQTYLRELLWAEGEELMDSDQEVILDEEIDIDPNFVKKLNNPDAKSDTADEPENKHTTKDKISELKKRKNRI